MYLIVSVLIFIIAFYLRLDAYLINNSFFTDEILLAMNLFELNYYELFLPLWHYFQSAPFLFLVLSKLLTSLLGINELCFRFIPFFTSILSVYLFYELLKVVIKNKWVQLIGLLTFGLSYQLLFYAQAFKQYSGDVLITILILLVSFKISKLEFSNGKNFLLGFLWTFCILFSFPAFLVLCGFFTANLIIKRNWKVLFSAICPFVFGMLYYVFNLSKVGNSEYLAEYWKKGFQIFSSEIYNINFDFLFHYYSYPIIFLLLFGLGLFYLYRNNKFQFTHIAATLGFTLLAAYLKIYPFERRLALFILPILILIIIYPLSNLKRSFKSWVVCALTAVFLFSGYFTFTKEFVSGNVSYLRQDVKPLLSVLSLKEQNEQIYLYSGSISAYLYYSKLYPLPNVIQAEYPGDETLSEKYLINDLNRLNKGVYYLFFVKGTWTYDKDLSAAKEWIKDNAELLNEFSLKSTYLAKIKIE